MSKDYEEFKTLRISKEAGMLFVLKTESGEEVEILLVNHTVYKNFTKQVSQFVAELVQSMIKKAAGDDEVRLDITNGSELN